jgi:hypothetical protein
LCYPSTTSERSRTNAANAQSNLENRNVRVVLGSRGGVGVGRLGLFNPLSATAHLQPLGTRKVWEITCRDFACENIFRTGVLAVTRVLLKRYRMKTGNLRSTRKSLCHSRGGISTRSFERIATRHPRKAVILSSREFEFPSKNLSPV